MSSDTAVYVPAMGEGLEEIWRQNQMGVWLL